MNSFTIAITILALIGSAMTFPTIDNDKEVNIRANRQRRFTCDVLSFGGLFNDSACAANCLSMGKAGGSCSGSICVCRETTFKELWDKRFGEKDSKEDDSDN